MKKIIPFVFILSVILVNSVFGQAKKTVAVLPTLGYVDSEIKLAIQDALQEGITNSTRYKLVIRGNGYLQALNECAFDQDSTITDETLLRKFGQKVGADCVCFAKIRKIGDNYRIAYNLIDVRSSSFSKAYSKSTQNGDKDLLDIINKIGEEMFNNKASNSFNENPNSTKQKTNEQKQSVESEVKQTNSKTNSTPQKQNSDSQNNNSNYDINHGGYRSPSYPSNNNTNKPATRTNNNNGYSPSYR